MNSESDRRPISADGEMGAELSSILDQAASQALAAPSVYNTQPWRWRVHDAVLDLSADRDRQLAAADPDGRMLAISCGVALHDARVTLAALGVDAEVTHLPDKSDSDLLARIRPTGQFAPSAQQLLRHQAIKLRHSDRRPFNDDPVSAGDVDALRQAAESHGAHLHTLRPDQIVDLTVTASSAVKTEFADSELRTERATWTQRPRDSRDGVPPETTVGEVPRKVPVRPLAPDLGPTLPAGEGTDRSTVYTVFFTDSDDVRAWLRTGEALGAALLLAVELGLEASVMSDLVEIPASRGELRRMLSGIGHPQIGQRPASRRKKSCPSQYLFLEVDSTLQPSPLCRRRRVAARTSGTGPLGCSQEQPATTPRVGRLPEMAPTCDGPTLYENAGLGGPREACLSPWRPLTKSGSRRPYG